MTELEYETVFIEVPAYIEQKTGTSHKTSKFISEVQCVCHLFTDSAVKLEASAEIIKTHPA
jgi:hypothetical protein